MKVLGTREHSVLKDAVVLGLKVEYDPKNIATWDGDNMLPFRAHKTLSSLVATGLMEEVRGGIYGRTFRATEIGRRYACRAPGCSRGRIYQPTDGAWDMEIGKCPACAGSGLLRSIPAGDGKGGA